MCPRSSRLENRGADRQRVAVKAEDAATVIREKEKEREREISEDIHEEWGPKEMKTRESKTERDIENREGCDALFSSLCPSLPLSLPCIYNGSKQRPREQIRHVFKYNTDSLASRQFGEWGCGVAVATPKRPLLLTRARSRG